MPKDPSKLPGLSRSEALKRLRKAGIEFKPMDKPTVRATVEGGTTVGRSYSLYDRSLGHSRDLPHSGRLVSYSGEAERAGSIALKRRFEAKEGLRQYSQPHKAEKMLGHHLLERYPKAAARRAIPGKSNLAHRVGKGAQRMISNIEKLRKQRLSIKRGAFGIGLTAASLGSSIKEAKKK